MTLDDAILAATGGPTVTDGLLAYYKAGGATSNDLDDAERQWLLANGAGFSVGPELVTDPSFTSTANWNEGIGWSVLAGSATIDGTNTSKSSVASTTSASLAGGTTYRIDVGISGYVQGEVQPGLGAFRAPFGFIGNGIHTDFYTPEGAGNITGAPLLDATPGAIMRIDFFSIFEVLSGNTKMHIDDLWYYKLRVVEGLTGTLNDMKLAFWLPQVGP